MQNRDLVVMGGSAGALPIVRRIIEGLPRDLAASVIVVLHRHPLAENHLVDSLRTVTPMTVVSPDDEPLNHGHIYVAPADVHLIVKAERIVAARGPRENQWRPSIDVLFRSAAVTYGTRVVGVLLTGELDDGTAGLTAIKVCGGVAVVQDPASAVYPTMPEVALTNVDVDHIVASDQIAPLLLRLVQEAAPPSVPIPDGLRAESKMAEEMPGLTTDSFAGDTHTELSCPDCGGPLWRMNRNGTTYRCLVGHAYRVDSLNMRTDQELERTVWAAIRQFEQRANIARTMAGQCRTRQQALRARIHDSRATESQEHADRLRQLQTQMRASNTAEVAD